MNLFFAFHFINDFNFFVLPEVDGRKVYMSALQVSLMYKY